MILKTTNADETLPVGIYKIEDNIINNLDGSVKVSKYDGKQLTRLAEIFIKNENVASPIDGGATWTYSDSSDFKEEEILSKTEYKYDTNYALLAEANNVYGCKVYKTKSDNDTSVIITSSEAKQLYVYQKKYNATFNSDKTIETNDMISFTIDVAGNSYPIELTTLSNNSEIEIMKESTDEAVATVKKGNNNISITAATTISVSATYNVFAIIDFTDRNPPPALYGIPLDKNTVNNNTGYSWVILNNAKLTENTITKSIVRIVSKN
jgi:hypothetical protein